MPVGPSHMTAIVIVILYGSLILRYLLAVIDWERNLSRSF